MRVAAEAKRRREGGEGYLGSGTDPDGARAAGVAVRGGLQHCHGALEVRIGVYPPPQDTHHRLCERPSDADARSSGWCILSEGLLSELAMPITHTASRLLTGSVVSLQLSGLAYSTADRPTIELCSRRVSCVVCRINERNEIQERVLL